MYTNRIKQHKERMQKILENSKNVKRSQLLQEIERKGLEAYKNKLWNK